MNCFVINLKKDTHKRQHMIRECNNVGITPFFIDAIYGKNLTQDELSNVYNEEKAIAYIGRPLTLGEIGCFLSHIKAYEFIIKNNIKQALVLEDDIIFDPMFNEVLYRLQYNTTLTYDTILLGHHGADSRYSVVKCSFWERKLIYKNFRIQRQVEKAYGTYGYLVSQKGAKKMLTYNRNIYLPLDHFIGNPEILNTFIVSPPAISIHNTLGFNHSNIENERKEYELKFIKSTVSQSSIKEFLKKSSLLKNIRRFQVQFTNRVNLFLKQIIPSYNKKRGF